jgi:hypothetical protein
MAKSPLRALRIVVMNVVKKLHVPRENRSQKGPGDAKTVRPNSVAERRARAQTNDAGPDQQGQQANTRLNTTHQGHQQDR